MTAAELRALIAGATKGPVKMDADFERDEMVVYADHGIQPHIARCDSEANATLIVALVNNAERFAELLAAEEARVADFKWMRGGPAGNQKLWVGSLIKGWIFQSATGKCWCGNTIGGELTEYPTESAARAAVEAAVRAG